MISIDIQGGLGNQLFMIFATFAYGIKHNVKVVFPYHKGSNNRGTYWDTLFTNISMFTTLNPENQIDIKSFKKYIEPRFLYDPLPDFGDENVCLLGYFQSPRYFDSVQSTIFQIINLSDKKNDIKNKYGFLFDKKTVSMHFRMGDYKQKRYYHPIINYEYFENALAHIIKNKPDVERVLYLCEQEDNDYVVKQIEQLHIKYPSIQFTKVDDSLPDYDQLIIMSCCDHNIMANSTFSWWGAYLNENPDKLICYPSVWFGEYYEHKHDYKDMMAPLWQKIVANPIHWEKPL